MKTSQWAPSGNALDGIPSDITRLLATPDGRTHGYGYGPGDAMIFGSEHGDITVRPRQWVTRHDDGLVTITDHHPDTTWVDCHGDHWRLGSDGLMHTPETRPFPLDHVERKWGPLRLIAAAA